MSTSPASARIRHGSTSPCKSVGPPRRPSLLDGAASASIKSVLVTAAPFTGTFAPLESQSVFAGDAANGTWTLHVTDSAPGDTGTVRSFTLYASGYTCTP